MMGGSLSSGSRRQWLVAGLVIIAIIIALQDSFAAMLRLWIEIDTFNHCLLIAPVSAWLIWRRRHALAAIEPSVSLPGLIMIVLVAGIWVLGTISSIAVVEHFAAVGLIPLSIWAILGSRFVRTIMFPLGYLLFLVPFGEFLIPIMMEFTADMTVAAVRASGVAVYHDGLYFEIPNGSFKIIEACSGIRMLIAAVAVGALFAYLNFHSWRRRVLFLGGVILLAIVANWMRAYSVVMVAHFSGMDIVADHVWLGYVVFAVVMAIMLWAGTRFTDIDHGAETGGVTEPSRPAAPRAVVGIVLMACLIIGIVGSVPVFASAVVKHAAQMTHPAAAQLPLGHGPWIGPSPMHDDWLPQFIGDTATQAGRYLGPEAAVDVVIISYQSLSPQSELINETNRVFDPERWLLIGETTGMAGISAVEPLAYIETEIRGTSGGRRLVRHWYVVDGRPYRSRVAVKLIELGNILTGRSAPAGVVAVSTRFGDDAEKAARVLDDFMAGIIR